MSDLQAAIKEIERVLIGNKSREVEKVYLSNAIRLIQECCQPELTKSQQIVLERLKVKIRDSDLCSAIHQLENSDIWGESEEPYDIAYSSLNEDERLEVVQAVCDWKRRVSHGRNG
ncbi:hypothetical protein [Enterococcus innesii]|uniref:hypothetical protein n=1 Tax=Enterococcus innesii TaxID=2839759 RepID=UPI002DB87DA5|nr:hypothetical protein [Enterococcus innesii]MEB5950524.1 hypothetical protein [Enterococcus innesii]